jgi:vesicle-fusing ATPase
MREIFKEAEDDMRQNGDEAKLHMIIFDEIDAVCRPRGSVSSSTGVHESVVNQFLAKLDGVESLDNILVIGMTNRKDMIDEAVLRPGRLEIHKEIGLPDFKGRIQIFEIHTRSINTNTLLSPDVDFDYLADNTKNYTGAEIMAVCRNAVQYTLFRDIDVQNIGKLDLKDIMNRKVTMEDFKMSLEEIKPQFGIDDSGFESRLSGGFIDYGPKFTTLYDDCKALVENLRNSETNSLLSVLLSGERGVGKTAFAAKIALDSGFPFVKMITPEDFVGYSETGKLSKIAKIFDDAYKSPLSLIVLDDLERLIEFIHIGPRFSNHLLQALLVLVKKKPSHKDRKLFVLGTTSIKSILEELDLVDGFNVNIKLPMLESPEEISAVLDSFSTDKAANKSIAEVCPNISMKDIILISEMAKQKGGGKLTTEVFLECYDTTR